uniref:tRNA (guanine(26)-N(2))-dimethyltransferase-like n=1 Tax=Styela clava TaxID=7725 RepID=UPI00193A5C34|nr:tRNA (guanine(26)-N(2))-dimethyltransferase-like [Styela clava]
MITLSKLPSFGCQFNIVLLARRIFVRAKSDMDVKVENQDIDIEASSQSFKEITEGRAKILCENSNNVFYNNVQEFNRDITIAAITEFAKEELNKKDIEAVEYHKDAKNIVQLNDENGGRRKVYPGEKCEEGIRILEALSATGLRSVRLAKEVPGVKEIIANDLSKSAVEAIQRNIEHNKVQNLVTANEDDASILMYNHKAGRKAAFDVIDLDPYGTASPFLDAAVQAVRPQGLLCVTCTDMAVLAGNTPESCWAKYRSMPLKTKACHEQALRILLGAIEQHANRYSRYIEPLLSVSVDFYIRVFVKVHFGLAKVKMSARKQAYVIRCGGCSSFHMQPVGEVIKTKNGEKHIPGLGPPVGRKCELCGHKNSVGGPIWAAPLYNTDFLHKVRSSVKAFPERLNTSSRINGFLTMMLEELPDIPLHYVSDELSSVMKCSCPPEVMLRSAIMNAGYRVSSFHGRKSSIKTDAPPNVIWDIMKAWFESCDNNKKKKLKEGTPVHALVTRTSTTEKIDFTKRDDAISESKKKGVVRFPTLPDYWGPKARAKEGSDGEMGPSEYLREKSKKFQGKRKNKNEETTEKKLKMDDEVQPETVVE